MKTTIDAVNGLFGSLEGKEGMVYNVLTKCRWMINNGNIYTFKCQGLQGNTVCEEWALVCSVDEFNSLVSYLENWTPTLLSDKQTYAEYKEKFTMENKPEMITVKGVQYQVGKLYLVSDEDDFDLEGDTGFYYLKGGSDSVSYPFTTNLGSKWKYCREINPADLGITTKAPVDMVDGGIYSFIFDGGDNVGYFDDSDNILYWGKNNFAISECSDITHLVPEGSTKEGMN